VGVDPVFVDIDRTTHNLDPDDAETVFDASTRGLLPVHLWGRACDVERLEAQAGRHRVALVFDAAHAFACTHRGRFIGGFGDAEVFSFHATKFINTFEGGAITTRDGDLADRLRRMRNFGFESLDNAAFVGTNGKLSEVSAAMGLACLDGIDEIVAWNRECHEMYAEGLRDVPGITLVRYDPTEKSNYQYVVIEVDERRANLSRDQLLSLLAAENVQGRAYFSRGCHQMAPYNGRPRTRALPATEAVCSRVLALPTGAAVREQDVRLIARIVRVAVERASDAKSARRASTAPTRP
jgi:dTDP-4-amino-4,6-dideoxygalactose transaminase